MLFISLFFIFVSLQSGLAIYGGYNTPDLITAFHISLQQCDDNRENCTNYCGGSLLSHHWFMTSAKCILSVPILNIKAVLGVIRLSDNSERREENVIDSYIVHPDYVDLGDASPHDIALVKFVTRTQWSSYIQPGYLLAQDQHPFNPNGWVPGWGDTTGDDSTTQGKDHLQIMDVELISIEECMDAITKLDPNTNITLSEETHLCTNWLDKDNATVSACSGDMGSSHAQNGPDLVGIVTWAIHPCKRGAPTVYTFVNHYVDWINSNIDDQL